MALALSRVAARACLPPSTCRCLSGLRLKDRYPRASSRKPPPRPPPRKQPLPEHPSARQGAAEPPPPPPPPPRAAAAEAAGADDGWVNSQERDEHLSTRERFVMRVAVVSGVLAIVGFTLNKWEIERQLDEKLSPEDQKRWREGTWRPEPSAEPRVEPADAEHQGGGRP